MASPLEESVAIVVAQLAALPLCMRVLWLATVSAAVLESVPEPDRSRAARIMASGLLGVYGDDAVGLPEGRA